VNLALPNWLTLPPPWLLPWHVALALSAVFLLTFVVARLQFRRAREDWANAFFYSPSTKTKQRQRRQKWQDRMWASLILTVVCAAAAGALYLQGPR
jgi:disulfide bond formation protein DsbB